MWLSGLCVFPEAASGIVAACLPVSPKFFQSVEKTGFYLRMSSALQSLLSIAGRKSSRYNSDRRRISLPKVSSCRQKPWSGNRQEPLDDQFLNDENTVDLSAESPDARRGNGRSQDPRTYILRTISIETRTEPKADACGGNVSEPTRSWQGASSCKSGVMV